MPSGPGVKVPLGSALGAGIRQAAGVQCAVIKIGAEFNGQVAHVEHPYPAALPPPPERLVSECRRLLGDGYGACGPFSNDIGRACQRRDRHHCGSQRAQCTDEHTPPPRHCAMGQ